MKHQLNRIISLLLAVLLCVAFCAVPASASEGTCGDNLTWSLQNGVLTIAGTGSMSDYTENQPAPWSEYADLIQRIEVSSGVTSVGRRAFYGLSNLTKVTLPTSVIKLGALAFAECTSLEQISIPNVEEIGWSCFYDCTSLVSIVLPPCLRSIGDQAFYQCSSLAGIIIPESVKELGIMAFTYCENLVYARIEAQITVLPNWTFYGCDLLWELYLPDSIETVETNALGECPNLYYVDYSGSDEVKAEIEYQLSQESVVESTKTTKTDVTFSQTDDATVTTKTVYQTGVSEWTDDIETGTEINATVTNPDGWEDVADSVKDTLKTTTDPDVDVQVQGDLNIPEGALAGLSDKDVTINIHTSDNVDWQIVMGDQTSDGLNGGQDLNVSISANTSDKYADAIGDAQSYLVTLGNTTLNSTLLIPLGSETARQVATLYIVDGKELVKVSSVIVDDDGKAAFCLAGTEAGEYILALGVQDIPQEEVLVPEKLAGEYDITYGATLTDSQGNQYVLTGRVNKLGFGLETLTWIIVGVLVGSVVLVGIVMVIWNKSQKQRYAHKHNRTPQDTVNNQ